jgi:predicted RNA-binding protein with EMAP domain
MKDHLNNVKASYLHLSYLLQGEYLSDVHKARIDLLEKWDGLLEYVHKHLTHEDYDILVELAHLRRAIEDTLSIASDVLRSNTKLVKPTYWEAL